MSSKRRRRQRGEDLSFLGEAEEAARRSALDELRDLAANANSEAVRVQAIKALLDRGYGVEEDNPLAGLTERELDEELRGFMDPGYMLPTEVAFEAASRALAEGREPEPREAVVDPHAARVSEVERLRLEGEARDARASHREPIPARRPAQASAPPARGRTTPPAYGPDAARQHIPPGLDFRTAERAFPDSYGRRYGR